jgi:hypothetical protein
MFGVAGIRTPGAAGCEQKKRQCDATQTSHKRDHASAPRATTLGRSRCGCDALVEPFIVSIIG